MLPKSNVLGERRNRSKVGFYQHFRRETRALVAFRQHSPAVRFPYAKLLNECKLFPYNQLSSFEIFGPVAVAQRVHYGTDITTWE